MRTGSPKQRSSVLRTSSPRQQNSVLRICPPSQRSPVLRTGSPKQRSAVSAQWFSKANEMVAGCWLFVARTGNVSNGSYPMQQSHPEEVWDNLNPGMLAAWSCYPMDEGTLWRFKGADGFPY